jgi:hypothetical protein
MLAWCVFAIYTMSSAPCAAPGLVVACQLDYVLCMVAIMVCLGALTVFLACLEMAAA